LRSDSLGVADGVGGWSGHAGANSARWARKFMHHCSAELARYENVDDELFLNYYEVDPVDVMQRAYEKTLSECKEEGTIGSSTALLAVLRNDELRLANLGDCSCCVIRGDEYIFRSEEQQHRFNYPFQAGTNAKDVPARDAQKFAVKVQRDDIVILASDGLVDNVFSDDLLEEVLRFVGSNANTAPRYTLRRFSPQAVSEALCFRAKSVYEDQRAVASPFQQRAMEEGIHFAGGKPDDVSCLVGVVGELEAAP
ncbi:phosphatase 2C-like domain-containing protein, partial [Rhodotorula diobovata]